LPEHQPLTFREESPTRKLLFAALIVFLCLVNFLVSWIMEFAGRDEPAGLLVYGSVGAILSQVALLGFILIYLPFGLIARIVAVCFLGMLHFGQTMASGAFRADCSFRAVHGPEIDIC
jgi:hypothetical protein